MSRITPQQVGIILDKARARCPDIPDEDFKTLRHLTELGLQLYYGEGVNVKVCPVCKSPLMIRTTGTPEIRYHCEKCRRDVRQPEEVENETR